MPKLLSEADLIDQHTPYIPQEKHIKIRPQQAPSKCYGEFSTIGELIKLLVEVVESGVSIDAQCNGYDDGSIILGGGFLECTN